LQGKPKKRTSHAFKRIEEDPEAILETLSISKIMSTSSLVGGWKDICEQLNSPQKKKKKKSI
jgi:hypothetical protein